MSHVQRQTCVRYDNISEGDYFLLPIPILIVNSTPVLLNILRNTVPTFPMYIQLLFTRCVLQQGIQSLSFLSRPWPAHTHTHTETQYQTYTHTHTHPDLCIMVSWKMWLSKGIVFGLKSLCISFQYREETGISVSLVLFLYTVSVCGYLLVL